LTVLALAAAAHWAAFPASAAVDDAVRPASAAAAGQDSSPDPPELTITAATAVVTAPDQVVTVKATLRNTSDEVISGNVNLRIADQAFASRLELDGWTTRGLDTVEDDAFRATSERISRLAPGERQSVTLSVKASGINLGGLDGELGWGPRGLVVDWETSSSSALAQDRTYVVYAPPEAALGQVSLSLVAGLTAGAGETREDAWRRLESVAAATAEPWISWALDPALLTPAENEDQTAPGQLADRVVGAVSAGKTVYALPYQDLDVAMLAQAQPDQAVGALSAAGDLGAIALRQALGEVAAAQVQTNLAWASRPLSGAEMEAIAAAGPSAILAAPNQLAVPPPGAVQRAPGSLVVAFNDAALSGALTASSFNLAENRILAESAFTALRAQADAQAASLVVALPRGWAPLDGGRLLQTLADAPWVRPTPLAALVNEPGADAPELVGAQTWPGPPKADLAALLDRLGQDVAFASLTGKPEEYLARALPPLLVPLSNTTREGSARAKAAQTALADAATALRPLQVVAGSELNLISEDGMVPVVVENQSNAAVNGLVVRLTAQTTAIRVGQDAALDLRPGQSATARVPVHALANGVFKVRVDLLDPDGAAVAPPATMTMRVRAEWENVGTAVVGAALGLVLVLGVVSTARKRRRARRQVQAADGETGAEAAADGRRAAGPRHGIGHRGAGE
jgi:hypothetical protein